jgi:hypothetical protein
MTIWECVFSPESAPAPTDVEALRGEARLLATLLSPALAKFAVDACEHRFGIELVDDGAARKSRLLNRLNAARQASRVAEIGEGGFRVLCLMAFANARTLYPDAALRATGDLDLLVRENELSALVDFLERRGFRLLSARLPRWRFFADGSAVALAGAEGETVNLHIHPGPYPAHRSLPTELAFARARRIEVEDTHFAVPSAEHALVICITKAAQDKFGPFAAAELFDAARLVQAMPQLNWDEVTWLAQKGYFFKPARVFFSLLAELGLPSGFIPAELCRPFRGITRQEFGRLVASWRALFAERTGSAAAFRREAVLCAEPRVGFHNAWARLVGTIAPKGGMPRFKERRI